MDPHPEIIKPTYRSSGKLAYGHPDPEFTRQQTDYAGYYTRPLDWQQVESKFMQLTSGVIDASLQDRCISVCRTFENISVDEVLEIIVELNRVS